MKKYYKIRHVPTDTVYYGYTYMFAPCKYFHGRKVNGEELEEGKLIEKEPGHVFERISRSDYRGTLWLYSL